MVLQLRALEFHEDYRLYQVDLCDRAVIEADLLLLQQQPVVWVVHHRNVDYVDLEDGLAQLVLVPEVRVVNHDEAVQVPQQAILFVNHWELKPWGEMGVLVGHEGLVVLLQVIEVAGRRQLIFRVERNVPFAHEDGLRWRLDDQEAENQAVVAFF